MSRINKTYQQLLKDILSKGFMYDDPNRKGVKRKQIADYRIRHDLSKDGLPLISLRKIHYDGAIGEFVSFMNGKTNLVDLLKNKVNFWFKDGYNYYKRNTKKPVTFDAFVNMIKEGNREVGDLGKIYPHQMRNWNESFDQIENLISTLQTNPMATKKTVTMWNPSDEPETSLTPCHWSFETLTEVLPISEREAYIKNLDKDLYDSYLNDFKYKDRDKALDDMNVPKYGLNIKWHQHSVDVFLGLPTNLVYYSLMCVYLSCKANMIPKAVIGDLSNVHLYDNAIKASYELLKRDPDAHPVANLKYKEAEKLSIKDFTIEGYTHDEAIKVEMLAYSK